MPYVGILVGLGVTTSTLLIGMLIGLYGKSYCGRKPTGRGDNEENIVRMCELHELAVVNSSGGAAGIYITGAEGNMESSLEKASDHG